MGIISFLQRKQRLSCGILCLTVEDVESRLKIGQKPFYVTSRSDVYKINDSVVQRVLQLKRNHEEADTRMLLHAKHASLTYPKVLNSSPDTDIFIICLSVHTRIAANLYFLTGVKNYRRIIDVSKVVTSLIH